MSIFTRFLGSGKTTLLNLILMNRQELKVAVVVNEFGVRSRFFYGSSSLRTEIMRSPFVIIKCDR
jgi:G3E family GTPase